MRAALVCLLAGVSIPACAWRGVTDEPFAMFPDSLFHHIRTVVVTPVVATGDPLTPGDAGAVLEAALEEQLRRAGFSVVPTFEYIGIWQHIADETGGFFDPFTGERDEELFNAAKRRLRAELLERFHADALVYPELWEGMAPFRDGVATWDGASQGVFGAYGLSGKVRALSLVVVIEDLTGTELFSNGVGFATIEAWYHNTWIPLVLEGVLEDPRLVSKAVSSVLAPIVEARKTDTSQARGS